MNYNIAIQIVGDIVWDGAASTPMRIVNFNQFGFSFKAVNDIAADAVFGIEAAPASDADPCVPGTFEAVQEISLCDRNLNPGDGTFTIPAGTVAGTICGGTIPCRSGAFVRLVPLSGDTAEVTVVGLRKGPQIGG